MRFFFLCIFFFFPSLFFRDFFYCFLVQRNSNYVIFIFYHFYTNFAWLIGSASSPNMSAQILIYLHLITFHIFYSKFSDHIHDPISSSVPRSQPSLSQVNRIYTTLGFFSFRHCFLILLM